MEIRHLRYFLAVAREENMTRAAGLLHVTQPTLSKALQALEEELGKKLILRRSCSIRLTQEGVLLRDRAEALISMADKIQREFLSLDDVTGGELSFGLAESFQIRYLARELRRLKERCPGLRYHITSGDTEQVTEQLDKGLLDFAVVCSTPDGDKYRFLEFPEADRFGLIVPCTHSLAGCETVSPEDLAGLPLFCSEQSWEADIRPWAGKDFSRLRMEGSFRLAFNGALFTREGLGFLLTLEHLVDVSPGSGLTFVPLLPELRLRFYLIWNRYQTFTPIAGRFLEQMTEAFSGCRQDPPQAAAF